VTHDSSYLSEQYISFELLNEQCIFTKNSFWKDCFTFKTADRIAVLQIVCIDIFIYYYKIE